MDFKKSAGVFELVVVDSMFVVVFALVVVSQVVLVKERIKMKNQNTQSPVGASASAPAVPGWPVVLIAHSSVSCSAGGKLPLAALRAARPSALLLLGIRANTCSTAVQVLRL